MAHDLVRNLDGNMTLGETEGACEIEQDGGFQLEAIRFDTLQKNGSTFLVNQAGFKRKLSGRLKNLEFVEIKSNDDPQIIKTSKENTGWTFICDTQLFDENLTKRVMVFGKKTFP